jgi:F-type H+-transporting ATPase subunit gamma
MVMTKRNQLKNHLHTLEDLGNIMMSMKNLCSIELNKMTRCLPRQEKVMQTIRHVGHDFFSAYPLFPLKTSEVNPTTPSLYILIGSERGFCGSFNDKLLAQLEEIDQQQEALAPIFIVVGRKLALKMANDPRVVRTLEGPNVIEEIPAVILKVLHALEEVSLQQHIEWRSWQWHILFNEAGKNQMEVNTLQPFQELLSMNEKPCPVPPVLNLNPDEFIAEFADQYLLALCYFIFYQSFYAENHQRLVHLSQALERLEHKRNQLKEHLRLLRQEEITEEIQMIMLSVEAIIGHEML